MFSGFELYPRWVPLFMAEIFMNKQREQGQKRLKKVPPRKFMVECLQTPMLRAIIKFNRSPMQIAG